jgi:maleamate amidohydrolase
MSDPYKDIGFDSNRIGFGRRAGIVVVDFQKGFTESRFKLGGSPMVERAVNNTAKLVGAARNAGLPVACCYTAYSSARCTVVEDSDRGQRIPSWSVLH